MHGGFQSFQELPSGYFFWLVAFLGGVDFHMARDYSGTEEFPSAWTPEFPSDIRNEARHLPGNAQSGVLQLWENLTPAQKVSKRAIEINNGRAAMMGILGLMVHEQLGNLDLIMPFGAPMLGEWRVCEETAPTLTLVTLCRAGRAGRAAPRHLPPPYSDPNHYPPRPTTDATNTLQIKHPPGYPSNLPF